MTKQDDMEYGKEQTEHTIADENINNWQNRMGKIRLLQGKRYQIRHRFSGKDE